MSMQYGQWKRDNLNQSVGHASEVQLHYGLFFHPYWSLNIFLIQIINGEASHTLLDPNHSLNNFGSLTFGCPVSKILHFEIQFF